MRHALWVIFILGVTSTGIAQTRGSYSELRLNQAGYFEMPGLDVMVFDDFYPEGHQGGLTIIQCGQRVLANGDLRLEPTPGQWSPVPKVGPKHLDRDRGMITVELWYPDSSQDRKGYNPIDYPDLVFRYSITAAATDSGIRLVVDLEKPLPAEWANKVGFNLELFPGHFFGEHYFMDGNPGLFPRQANGPMLVDSAGDLQIAPMAEGKQLIIAPGNDQKEIRLTSARGNLQLIDGRGLYNNGWFVLRSTIPGGAVKRAVEWMISPRIKPGWRSSPAVQVSQIGYHPKQTKWAVIELDKSTGTYGPIQLWKVEGDSESVVKADNHPKPWGKFLRYRYLRFDFSDVTREGLYKVRYGGIESQEFEIRRDVFARGVWQPTLEYFLPVQMCHMRINDRYKVWHGLCHMDDALMAPINHNHFDGYLQGPLTLTRFKPGEHIPGVNIGGWHDAGDYDIRIESQAETVYKLALAYELFRMNYDATSIDQKTRVVELHRPDGKPDILQQIEHGVLSIVGGYESLGRLYRGIICPTLRQYTHLGDASTMTDNLIYRAGAKDSILHQSLPMDDRWLFTEVNEDRELYVAQRLAAAGRVLDSSNPTLGAKCLKISEELYGKSRNRPTVAAKINAAGELYLATSRQEYASIFLEHEKLIADSIGLFSTVIGRVAKRLGDSAFSARISAAVKHYAETLAEKEQENPYGVTYAPFIWGSGWDIQSDGVDQLLLSLGFPDVMSPEYGFKALNFVLGCHPGENTASFASGVGVKSLTVAYGANRDEWSYIPGGVASGTALIRPDLPELKTWPYFWQQTEYVMGGGAADYMFLAMAADFLLNH